MNELKGIHIVYSYVGGNFENGYKKAVPTTLLNYKPTTGEVTHRYGRKVIVISVPTATDGFFTPGGWAGIATPHFKYGLDAGKNVLEMIGFAGEFIVRNYYLCRACYRLTGKMGGSRFGPSHWYEKENDLVFLIRRVQCFECTHTWKIKTFYHRQP